MEGARPPVQSDLSVSSLSISMTVVLPSATTTAWTAPTGLAAMIAIAQGQAAGLKAMPAGYISPNLDGGYEPENRGGALVVVAIVSMTVALFLASARLATRWIVAGKLWIDDWMIIPATVRIVKIRGAG
jgi:hypothetical protein